MENLFSNIFFACFVIKNKKTFVSKSGSQHHGAEFRVSADVFGTYDEV